MSGSQTMLHAASRCQDLNLVDLKAPFGNLLNALPAELARMPGSPALVMMAQCLSYLKSNHRFREPLISDQKAFSGLCNILLQTPEIKPAKKG